MKAKLIVEGREFPIEIQDPELQKLLMPKKKTGYERVEYGEEYYYIDCENVVDSSKEEHLCVDADSYNVGNYYSDYTVAENNARADKLMRQLRRFAVEHRWNNIAWKTSNENYYIYYDREQKDMTWCVTNVCQVFGTIYFDSEIAVTLAIKTFHDELIWYFTEYKDSL